jgi:hypothetical protein
VVGDRGLTDFAVAHLAGRCGFAQPHQKLAVSGTEWVKLGGLVEWLSSKEKLIQVPVVHVCNCSYSVGRDHEDLSLRFARTNGLL